MYRLTINIDNKDEIFDSPHISSIFKTIKNLPSWTRYEIIEYNKIETKEANDYRSGSRCASV